VTAIEVRRIGVDDWPVWRELRLAALTEAPDAFGSVLADWQGAGDTPRRWIDRLISVPANFVAYVDGRPAGMGSGRQEADGSAQLISFWVAPAVRGGGVCEALVAAIAGWARAEDLHPLTLDVKAANVRAHAAYRRCGFLDCDRAADDPSELTMIWQPA
jgi:ribosomal protein S18 acetylase RimI-like enzyme